MTDAEAVALIDRVSHEVAGSLRPQLHELERENDRLLGEMRALKRRMTAERTRLEQEIANLGSRLREASDEAGEWKRRALELEAERQTPEAVGDGLVVEAA